MNCAKTKKSRSMGESNNKEARVLAHDEEEKFTTREIDDL